MIQRYAQLFFLDAGLGIVSPAHFVYDFLRKMFLMLYSINTFATDDEYIRQARD